MKKVLWPLGLLLFSAITLTLAAGGEATVSWLAPTQYVDGTAIAAGDLDHYTITWTATGSGGPSGSMTVTGTALASIVPFACGQANFSITVTTSTTSKYPGITSGPAGPVFLDTKVACATNPPGALAVQFSADGK